VIEEAVAELRLVGSAHADQVRRDRARDRREEADDIVLLNARVASELEQLEEAVFWTDEGYRRFPEKRGFAGMRLLLLATPRLHTDSSVDLAWQAVRDLERVELPDKWPSHWMKMAIVLAAAGLRDSAESVIRRAHEAGVDDPFVLYYEAKTRLNLDDRQEALRLLGEFLEGRPDFRPYVAEDWWFRPLYDDSTFVALVKGPDRGRRGLPSIGPSNRSSQSRRGPRTVGD
jgi:tetratricopeptide (TPR) repeat protein